MMLHVTFLSQPGYQTESFKNKTSFLPTEHIFQKLNIQRLNTVKYKIFRYLLSTRGEKKPARSSDNYH